MSHDTSAARGTIALTTGNVLFFMIGYVAVVLLAREMGPAVYGTYGVIMSILVWMEQSARQAVPTAAAKLIAEGTGSIRELGRAALALNLVVYLALFVALLLLSSPLARWLQIDNGVVALRLAALDLPFFGIYTALQGIHLGKRGFFRLAVSHVTYAVAKLVGIALIVSMGVSIEKALIVNVVATVAGIVFLLGKLDLRGAGSRLPERKRLIALAAPLGVFSVSSLLLGSLDLWLLKAFLPTAQNATVGLYVAALNVARVPAVAIATVGAVSLPALSGAIAQGDRTLVRTYVNQTLRFFFILYLPTCLVLFAQPERLMTWIYSVRYSGGGTLLVVLVLAQGSWALHGIVASLLVASGKARTLAVVTALAVPPSAAVLWWLVGIYGAPGAATASAVIALAGVLVLGVVLRRRLGPTVDGRSMARIATAGGAMFAVALLCPAPRGLVVIPPALGLLAYAVVLLLSGEVRRADIETIFRRSERQDP